MTVAARTTESVTAQPPTDALSVQMFCAGVLLASVVFFNEANFRNVDVENFSFDWQIGLRLLICAACGVYGCTQLPRTLPYLCTMPGILSVLLAGWAVATVPFAVSPVYAAAASAALWCLILAAPAMLLALGPERFLQMSLFALAVYLIGSWIVYLAVPDLGQMQEVDGAIRFGGLNHPNTTGRQASLAIGLALTAGLTGAVRWKTLLPLFALASVTLLLTDSRTATCAAIAALLVVFYRKVDFTTKYLFAYLAFVVAVIWFAFLQPELDRSLSALSRSGEAEEIVTLTGRTDLWAFALRKLVESPIVGYGYGCSRFVIAAEHYWPTHHAHNVILNMMLGGGVIGGCLLLAMFWNLLGGAIRTPEYFPDVILVLVLVGGIADTVMFSPIPDSHTLMWLAALAWRPLLDVLQQPPMESY